jgi:hypothetical protein
MTDDLETRVRQFELMELPGQPMMMHVGTSTLVADLWREVKRLRAQSEVPTRSIQSMSSTLAHPLIREDRPE